MALLDPPADALAERFESERARLRAVAQRMLGSRAEADDAVQEAWLRLSRADTTGIDNLSGWLTTVVARVCLDLLRARRSRREDPVDAELREPLADDLERETLLADSLGPALLVVLETLAPGERLALVLHDMFGVPFEEIAAIAVRTPAAARQLASRGRRRIQGASATTDVDRARKREVVRAFLAASRGGDFAALLQVLDPAVVVRADATAAGLGAATELRGPDAVAQHFATRARGGRAVLIDGGPAAAWAPGGRPKVLFEFTVVHGRITAIDLRADPERFAAIDLVLLEKGV